MLQFIYGFFLFLSVFLIYFNYLLIKFGFSFTFVGNSELNFVNFPKKQFIVFNLNNKSSNF